MSLELPEKPNLEHLKKQAKDLLHRCQQGDAAAAGRFRSFVSFSAPAGLKLADAQHVLAREYGFAAWPKLKEHVDSLTQTLSPGQMLCRAIRATDSRRVARLLESKPELAETINEPLADFGAGMPALLAAVLYSDRKTIDVLLRFGADISTRSHVQTGGIGVLDECAPEMAAFLIERGAAVDAHSASRLGMLDNLRDLVAADPAIVHARGANGQTPLHFASAVEVAEYLLDHDAEIDARDVVHESTPAQHMLRVVQARHYPRDRQDVARFLVSRGCQTDILMASALGDLPLVRRHVEADPDCLRMRVSGKGIYIPIFGKGRTPHLIARDFGHEDVFQFLMQHSPEDVKIAQACELGDEGLFRAAFANKPNLMASLSDEDRRRLPDAAQNNNTGAVRLMLQAGWPVDATGEYDMTALQWASWHGNAAMVREILRHGPKLETLCEHKITAQGCALHGSENSWHRQTGDYAATVEALLDAGAKAPKLTDDLEASQEVREVLRRYEERGG